MKYQASWMPQPIGADPLSGLYTDLQWREVWWLWQFLALAMASLTSPTLLVTWGLLARDARSDHPAFWAGLIAIVPLGNLVAAAAVHCVHCHRPLQTRLKAWGLYTLTSLLAGGMGFTWIGWETGFLPDIFQSLGRPGPLPDLLVVLASLGVSIAYATASFFHAGMLFAWLAFSGHERKSVLSTRR